MTEKKQKIKETYIGKANNLESLIEYQADSVISKTIIGKKAGTVTLFAFDKDQGLSEHTAAYDALVYMLDGEAQITISGKGIVVKKGEMVILPANEPHALEALSPYKMLLVMIKSE
ncbi:MAG: cupin domain-containing protein [Flavobacteriaceae bacterium]|nr:cupin domain-containing protein [Flavobacteriaceae bacterium]